MVRGCRTGPGHRMTPLSVVNRLRLGQSFRLNIFPKRALVLAWGQILTAVSLTDVSRYPALWLVVQCSGPLEDGSYVIRSPITVFSNLYQTISGVSTFFEVLLLDFLRHLFRFFLTTDLNHDTSKCFGICGFFPAEDVGQLGGFMKNTEQNESKAQIQEKAKGDSSYILCWLVSSALY